MRRLQVPALGRFTAGATTCRQPMNCCSMQQTKHDSCDPVDHHVDGLNSQAHTLGRPRKRGRPSLPGEAACPHAAGAPGDRACPWRYVDSADWSERAVGFPALALLLDSARPSIAGLSAGLPQPVPSKSRFRPISGQSGRRQPSRSHGAPDTQHASQAVRILGRELPSPVSLQGLGLHPLHPKRPLLASANRQSS